MSGHSFAVAANRLFAIDAVDGCGGTLTGGTFTTGTIDADCTIAASFAASVALAVEPRFPTAGADWNDYVAGADIGSAIDQACDPDADAACLHAGDRRVVEIPAESCSGLEGRDELGAFRWVCDDSSGDARFFSAALAADQGLADLIDVATPAFAANSSFLLSVDGDADVIASPAGAWWGNPVVAVTASGSLDAASTIHVVAADLTAELTIDADKAALVIAPGATLATTGTAVATTDFDHLWIEGAVDAAGALGVSLTRTRFSVVRRLSVENSLDAGLLVSDCSRSRFSSIAANNNGADGIFVREDGLATAGGNRFERISASNNTGRGVNLLVNHANHFAEITAFNNGSHGVLQLSGSNNTFAGTTAGSNGIGFANAGASAVIFGLTAANNGTSGVALAGNDLVMAAVVSTNNLTGFDHLSGARDLFADLAFAANDTGILLGGDLGATLATRFTGLLLVGNTADCVLDNGTEPGLDGACANTGLSDATLTTAVDLSASFTGKAAADDAANASDTNGAATFPADPTAFDWASFDNRFRGWGLDGSDFPDADHRARWTAGDGRIWDLSVAAGDAVLLGRLAVPTGDDTLTSRWDGTPATDDDAGCDALIPGSSFNATDSVCQTVYLRDAVELAGDDAGNDNNLCESGETCLYMPNIGSYQGHGALVSAGAFTGGAITGVTLLRFETNGR